MSIYFCISHLPWVTLGVGETIVPLNDEVTADEKLATKDEVLARGSGFFLFLCLI